MARSSGRHGCPIGVSDNNPGPGRAAAEEAATLPTPREVKSEPDPPMMLGGAAARIGLVIGTEIIPLVLWFVFDRILRRVGRAKTTAER